MRLQIIGDPVLHSKSPALHGAMLSALGLDIPYDARTVRRGELPEYLTWAEEHGVTGFNATMPHKEELVGLMDSLDPLAEKSGAVNTVCIKDGKYYGYNTDGPGFLRALADLKVETWGKRVLLLGAGGAAKAVGLALAGSNNFVTICNRSVTKSEALCSLEPGKMTPAGFSGEELAALAEKCDILVNCTPLGMEGTEADFADLGFLEALPSQAAVCDLIYAPAETALLKRARELGHPAMNGLGMLLHQATLALEHFTGQSLEVEKARAAALKALGEKE